MITALLALVAIALTIISVASLTVFRSYLQGQAGTQVTTLYDKTLQAINDSGPFSGHITGFYAPPDVVEVLTTTGQVLTPAIATGQSWLRPERAHRPGLAQDSLWAADHGARPSGR